MLSTVKNFEIYQHNIQMCLSTDHQPSQNLQFWYKQFRVIKSILQKKIISYYVWWWTFIKKKLCIPYRIRHIKPASLIWNINYEEWLIINCKFYFIFLIPYQDILYCRIYRLDLNRYHNKVIFNLSMYHSLTCSLLRQKGSSLLH